MSDSEEIGARSSRNDGGLDPSVGAAIQSAVSESMGSLADLPYSGYWISAYRFREAIFRGKQLVRWTSSQESSARTLYLQKEIK